MIAILLLAIAGVVLFGVSAMKLESGHRRRALLGALMVLGLVLVALAVVLPIYDPELFQ